MTPDWNARQAVIRAFDSVKNAFRVLVANDNSQPIPVAIVGQVSGDPFYEDFNGAHPSGTGPHDIIVMTVPASKTRNLSRLKVSCRQESVWTVTLNGTVIATLRTGAARPSDSFEWSPSRACAASDEIKVILTKRLGSSDTDVGAHLSGVET